METRLKIKRNSLKKAVTNRHCLKFSKNNNNNKKIHLKISWNNTKRMKCHENQLHFRFIWESFFFSLSLDVLSCNIKIPFFRKCLFVLLHSNFVCGIFTVKFSHVTVNKIADDFLLVFIMYFGAFKSYLLLLCLSTLMNHEHSLENAFKFLTSPIQLARKKLFSNWRIVT